MGFNDTTAVELWFLLEFFETLRVRGDCFCFGIDRARFLALIKCGGAVNLLRMEYSDAKKLAITFVRGEGDLALNAVYFQVPDFEWTFNEREYKNILRMQPAEFDLVMKTLRMYVLGEHCHLWDFRAQVRGATFWGGDDC